MDPDDIWHADGGDHGDHTEGGHHLEDGHLEDSGDGFEPKPTESFGPGPHESDDDPGTEFSPGGDESFGAAPAEHGTQYLGAAPDFDSTDLGDAPPTELDLPGLGEIPLHWTDDPPVGSDPDDLGGSELDDEGGHLFPPELDLSHLLHPVDGYPWADAGLLGGADAAPFEPLTGALDAGELAAYAGHEGASWAELKGAEDPATSVLARWFSPT